MCLLHTRPRVQRAPGLPCALYLSRGFKMTQTRVPHAARMRTHTKLASACSSGSVRAAPGVQQHPRGVGFDAGRARRGAPVFLSGCGTRAAGRARNRTRGRRASASVRARYFSSRPALSTSSPSLRGFCSPRLKSQFARLAKDLGQFPNRHPFVTSQSSTQKSEGNLASIGVVTTVAGTTRIRADH
jgi:hypothetical protein